MARENKILDYQHSKGETRVCRLDDLPIFSGKTYVVSDEFFKATLSADYYVIANEQNKSFEICSQIIAHMLEVGVERDWNFVTIGGGVIGDIGGFIASIFMRGIRWTNVPTTLLAQVDSCLGGKTGINLAEGKNLLGSFYQPAEVLIYSDFLKTLSAQQIKSGWGEIVKYSMISEEFQPEMISTQLPSESVVDQCLRIKAQFIEEDEFDNLGKRVLLNYGHTLAHGIEKLSQYEISHGEAVFWGVIFEQFMNGQSNTELIDQYKPLSQKLIVNLDSESLIAYLRKDKKGALSFFDQNFKLRQINESEFIGAWKEFTSFLKTC